MEKLSTKVLVLSLIKSFLIAFLAYIAIAILLFTLKANLAIILFGFVIVEIVVLGWNYLKYTNFVYEIGAGGITIESGILAKNKVVIPYKSIQNVDIPRSLFDRMLGLSNIKIQTAADSGVHEGVIPGLDSEQADKIQKKILSHKG